MKRYIKIGILLLFAVAICLTSGKVFNIEITSHEVSTLNDSTACFAEAVSDFAFYKYDKQNHCFALYNSKDQLVSKAVFSSPYCNHIKGYNGNIPLVIFFDNSDKIQKIQLLDHYETPSFISRIEKQGLLNSWTDMPINQAVSQEIDAVSGATYSSKAIIEAVQLRMQKYIGSSVSNIENDFTTNIISLVASLGFLLFAGFCFWEPKRTAKFRLVLLIASIGILGFWQGQFISISKLSGWLINGINWQMEIFLFVVLIAAIIAPLFLGKQFYCTYVCPFGASQELIGKINKKHKLKLSPKLVRWLKYLRYVMIVTLGGLLCTSIDISVDYFEPFSAFLVQSASLTVLIIAGVVLIISIFINRPWCNFLCPTGAFFAIFAKSKKKKSNSTNQNA